MLFLRCTLAMVVLSASAIANDGLQRIPENALGFVVVSDLGEASDKIEQLLEPLDVTVPAPLAFGKIVTGLDAGIDTAGSMIVTLLSGDRGPANFEPMVLLPISNYAEFAQSINADTSGEICRVTLMGEDVLVGRDGSYAMLMNVEHRATMEELVTYSPEPLPQLAPIAEWLDSQDVAVVMMPTGIAYLKNRQPQPTRPLGLQVSPRRSQTAGAQLLSMIPQSEVTGWLSAHAEVASLGAQVDDQANVRLTQRVVLRQRSPLAAATPLSSKGPGKQLGLSSAPCVFSATGPINPAWSEKIAAVLQHSLGGSMDGQQLPAELAEQGERAYQLLLRDVRGLSILMLPGEDEDPLVSNFVGLATVTDVEKNWEALPQYVKMSNEIVQKTPGDIKLTHELMPSEIDGKQGFEMTIDVATTARDPNVPLTNWMLNETLEADGKLHIHFVKIDDSTIAFGVATRKQMAELLKLVDRSTAPAQTDAKMRATQDLLNPAAPWQLLIRPQGCMQTMLRFHNEFMILLNSEELKLPKMPDSPPVGLSFEQRDRQWIFEFVCPQSTWQALGSFYANAKNQ